MSYDDELRLRAALHEIFGHWPYLLDIERVERRGRRLWRARLAWCVAAATFAVLAVATACGLP